MKWKTYSYLMYASLGPILGWLVHDWVAPDKFSVLGMMFGLSWICFWIVFAIRAEDHE